MQRRSRPRFRYGAAQFPGHDCGALLVRVIIGDDVAGTRLKFAALRSAVQLLKAKHRQIFDFGWEDCLPKPPSS
jgi:hypothetical protein